MAVAPDIPSLMAGFWLVLIQFLMCLDDEFLLQHLGVLKGAQLTLPNVSV